MCIRMANLIGCCEDSQTEHTDPHTRLTYIKHTHTIKRQEVRETEKMKRAIMFFL